MPKAKRAKSAVSAGVRVAADDGHAGFGKAEFWSDDVDDALIGRLHVVEFDAEVGAVFAERFDLAGGYLVDDVEAVFDAAGGDVVVDCRDSAVGPAELAASHAEAVEGLRAGDLVDEVQVDVEDRGFACGLGDEVLLPDFFEESFRCAHGCAFCSVGGRVKVFAPVAAFSTGWGVPSGSTTMALRIC